MDEALVCRGAIPPQSGRQEGALKLIYIAGTWGSGTTAMAGALAHLGVPTLGPLLETNDPRTPNAYELEPLRNILLTYMDEATLSLKPNVTAPFARDLQSFARDAAAGRYGALPADQPERLLVKIPLGALALPYLQFFFDLSIILVHRPLEEVEQSRLRRGWPPLYGLAGGRVLMNKTLGNLMAVKKPFLGVSYAELTSQPQATLKRVIDFCDLHDLQDNIETAAGFIRQP